MARPLFRHAVLAAALVGASCERKENPPPAAAAPSEAPWIEIPAGEGDSDPLSIWTRELTRSRMSRVPRLTWTCTKSPAGLLLQTPVLGFSCDSIRKQHPSLPLTCLAESLLRAEPAECQSESFLPPLLHRMWLPAGSGLYLEADAAGVLRPDPSKEMAARLPALKLVAKPGGPLSLAPPRTWLKQGAATGPLALALTPVGDESDTLPALWALVRASREAVDLPLFLDPLGKPPAEPAAGSVAPLFRVRSGSRASPYDEACEYVGRWLLARSMAKGLDPSTARVRELRCDFSWAADLVPGRSLVLSRLPLPLFSPGKGIFVLKSEEESLSPTSLRAFLTGP